MRALGSLHDQFSDRMPFLHSKRFEAMWRGVNALVSGRGLWLTALGRAWPSEAKRKHAVKAADRLLGNDKLHRDRFRIAAASVRVVLSANCKHPILLIDTMEIRHKVVALTASLAHDGRALPIWSTTLKTTRANAKQCRRFLDELSRVLPANCKPILVTDAGFERAWFDEVEKRGWDYLGRVRGQIKFVYRGETSSCLRLHHLAHGKPKDLGLASFPISNERKRRLILSALPKSMHRRRKTRRGKDRDSNYLQYRKNVHEPLLLTTSLRNSAARVVSVYKLRMQIEQSFRDLKCHRWGWSLRHCLSRSRKRLELLLLIASIAMIAQQIIGTAAELRGLHKHYQANTVRDRRVLSLFTLGGMILRDDAFVHTNALKTGMLKIRFKIDHLRGKS